jgi:uncharacterized OB-fold protein
MSRRPRLDARRCARGHVSLHADDACAICGEPTQRSRVRGDAVLELVTTVRVNPSGQPFQLGVAVLRAGRSRTLCRIEGAVRGLGNDAVMLERRGDVIVAKRRLRARSRARFASRRYGRRC